MVNMEDTGKRTTYEGGAQREPHQGKGRYDWISPFALERVVAAGVRIKKLPPDPTINHGRQAISACLALLNRWREGYRDEDYLATAAWWIFDAMHYEECGCAVPAANDVHDFGALSPWAMERLAFWYEAGGVKYKENGERNWERGMPFDHPVDSGMRHLNKWLEKTKTEDNLAAAVWNLFALMHYEACHMDQFDNIPRYPEAHRVKIDPESIGMGTISPGRIQCDSISEGLLREYSEKFYEDVSKCVERILRSNCLPKQETGLHPSTMPL